MAKSPEATGDIHYTPRSFLNGWSVPIIAISDQY
jgi:hypothetical protein